VLHAPVVQGEVGAHALDDEPLRVGLAGDGEAPARA
jgi:hypothetical protein